MEVEVKEKQSQHVDWTDNPQLVVNDQGIVVLVNKMSYEDTFVGVAFNLLPSYSTFWCKADFKPFDGELVFKPFRAEEAINEGDKKFWRTFWRLVSVRKNGNMYKLSNVDGLRHVVSIQEI